MSEFRYEKIKVGADPELFLTDATGKYISAIEKIGGSKEHPKKIDRVGHAVQEDNVLVEYNIKPARTLQDFVRSHEFVLNYLKENLPEYKLNFAASAEFAPDQLKHPRALVFGCDPDYNAWKLEVNPPINARGVKLRTAGGHIHVGYLHPSVENQIALIRALDLFLGVPSVLLDPDNRRRELYGKAGAFRPKEYGVEFRTLSNFWISDRSLLAWAFTNAHRAIGFLNGGHKISEEVGEKIQETINKGNKSLALTLCNEFAIAGV